MFFNQERFEAVATIRRIDRQTVVHGLGPAPVTRLHVLELYLRIQSLQFQLLAVRLLLLG